MAVRTAVTTAVLTVTLCAALSIALPNCASDSQASLQETSDRLGIVHTYLVLYRAERVPTEAAHEVARAGGTLVASYDELGVAVARSTRDDFAAELQKSRFVEGVAATTGTGVNSLTSTVAQESASSARVPKPTVPPLSEPLAAMQWNMSQIHAAEARAITPGKKSVIVGVLDSGIDDGVVDLAGQVDASRSVSCLGGVIDRSRSAWSHDTIGHGTHVAGIIGAKENGKGTVGIAPGATLAAVKLTEDGLIYPEAFICGLYWAATHEFDLVNASLFTDPWYYHCSGDPAQRVITLAEQRAVTFAMHKGVTVVAATSNEQQDLAHAEGDPFGATEADESARKIDESCKLLPVELSGVIGVSAVDARRNLAYYSNYGLGVVDLAAPGGDLHVPVRGNAWGQIVSAVPSYSYYYQTAIDWQGRVGVDCSDGLDANDAKSDPESCKETYALLQGTSQATPHVTGVAALALSHFGKLSPSELLAKLTRGATRRGCPRGVYQPYPEEMPEARCEGSAVQNGFYGAGIVDALATLRE
jgi:subtilisin family serine protease